MRILIGVLAGLAALLLLVGGVGAEVFVVGPRMLGHPANDPSVGYSALELDLDMVYPGAWYVYTPEQNDRVPHPAEKAARPADERPRS
jgi:hypothetical protein